MKKIEEIQFQVQAKSHQIKKFLMKSQTQRMPFQAIQLAQILKKVYFFQRHFDTSTQDFINLTLLSDLIKLKPNQILYQQSQKSEFVYMIIQGTIILKKNDIQIKIGAGQTIGQLQILLQVSERQSIAKAENQTICMRLPNNAIRMNLKNGSQIKQFLHMISISSYFEDLTIFQKNLLVTRIQKHKFIEGQYLIKSGDYLDHIIWIVRGTVSVVKQIKFKNNNYGKSVTFKIDTLQQGQIFGEQQSLMGTQANIGLVCDKSGCFYKLNISELKNLSRNIYDLMSKNCKQYPSDEQIMNIYNNEIAQGLLKTKKIYQLRKKQEDYKKYNNIKKIYKQLQKMKHIQKPTLNIFDTS